MNSRSPELTPPNPRFNKRISKMNSKMKQNSSRSRSPAISPPKPKKTSTPALRIDSPLDLAIKRWQQLDAKQDQGNRRGRKRETDEEYF